MTIRRRLLFSAIISIGLVCILALLWYISYRQMAEETRKQTITSDMVQKMTDLIIVTEEYLTYQYPRSEQQWQAKYNDILIKLEQTTVFPISIRNKLDKLYHSFSQIQLIYNQKEILIQNRASNEEINRKIILEERISANMRLTSREIIMQAIKIFNTAQANRTAISKRNTAIIFTYVFFMIVISLFNAYITIKSIIPPLSELVQGASIIEFGELKYIFGPAEKESHIRPDDEIGELATAFNSMTRKLVDSLKKLESEIEERHKVEEALRIERDNLNNIFKAMADGVYIVNKDYDIQYANPVLKKTFGSLEGKKCHEHFHDSDEPCTFCRNGDVFAGKTVRWEWYSKKNQRTYDIIDTPMKNADGSISKLEIFRDITERKQAEERLKKTMNATIETMSKIIEVKDPYTAGHQQRVFRLATAIAKELNLSQDKIEGIRISSLIHDIGKIGVPTETLSKTTTLSDIEFSLIKDHSRIGSDILKSIDFFYPVAQIILQHHEKINGSGYPRGLKGDEILLEARIICVADVVEAMSSHRPYRPALGIDKALEEISQNKDVLYDPEVVDACLKIFKEKKFKFES